MACVEKLLAGENLAFPLDTTMTIGSLNARNDLFIHSPTPFNEKIAEKIKGLGREIRMIIAPNLQHWLFVEEWAKCFPEAQIWIAESALGEDLAQKLHDLPVKVMKVLPYAFPTPYTYTNQIGRNLRSHFHFLNFYSTYL